MVIPTLDAANGLAARLAALAGDPVDEIVVADGGSTDATLTLARAAGAVLVAAPRGRGVQLAAGIAAARGDWLLLLHADTSPGTGWRAALRDAMRAGASRAHYFRFALDSDAPQARRLERLVAWRCRTLALPYGDQGLLIARSLLQAAGGLRPLPLMEDVDLVRRLGRDRLAALPVPALTSAARWERDGWTRRSARNLLCLSLWYAGVPPGTLRRLYAAGSGA